ncbi:MAG TPA: 3-isopropylmalate dehydratase small subunit [Gammaproteobacteria bacterium]|jgi:3-isopropylmalate/(R)-2-methylmalate dehydratase small subunit|nr:3-isopropylmalate dehydratase small subunit [Gammaproteobacteria bacterium]HIK76630.1 3-isopropylmalate dehydratase small subunit [Gammaproteobacteria bacterium]
MKPFNTISGIAAPLMRINIDTDTIIPSREMKTVSKKGLASGLFADWRYISVESREENPDFILNQFPYNQAKILLSGSNFGCGSSREHAVWAIHEWGIKVIIAPSFGSIFYNNCIKNGVLPINLDEEKIASINHFVAIDPMKNKLYIDLNNRIINYDKETIEHFPIDEQDQAFLINGLDQIDQTLNKISLINDFEEAHRGKNPWL